MLRAVAVAEAVKYVGVLVGHWRQQSQSWSFVGNYRADRLGTFGSAEEAARAWDGAARRNGKTAVNFPEAGSAETQADRLSPPVVECKIEVQHALVTAFQIGWKWIETHCGCTFGGLHVPSHLRAYPAQPKAHTVPH
jgi:hypothetical protein